MKSDTSAPVSGRGLRRARLYLSGQVNRLHQQLKTETGLMVRSFSLAGILVLFMTDITSAERNPQTEILQAPDPACAIYRAGGVAGSKMLVGTFHHRGVIADPRRMEITWPRASRIFAPTVINGRATETDKGMSFRISIDTGAPLIRPKNREDLLKISINAVDYYPLYSYVGAYGNMQPEHRTLEYRSDGTTYRSSEGYIKTGRTLPGGWVGLRYPNKHKYNDDLYVRWNEADEVEAVLACHPLGSAPNPLCTMRIKDEPIFAEVNFDRDRLDDLALIERRTRDFTRCLMRGK